MENSNQLPKFIHPEVEVIYNYDLNIPSEKIEAILQLPRETLIEDLKTVLNDAILRFDYFEKKGWGMEKLEFPTHALWLLADLKAEETLPEILNLLRQSNDLLEFWFGESVAEGLYEVVYHIGNNSLDQLKSFFFEPNIYWTARLIPSTVAEQIAIYQPERREEIVKWYQSVFEDLLALDDSDPLLDGDYISFLVADVISFNAIELLELIKQLYDRGVVFDGIIGSYESVKKDLLDPTYHTKRKIYTSIFDRYKDAVTGWHSYRLKYEKDYYKRKNSPPKKKKAKSFKKPAKLSPKHSPYFRTEKKISRNSPCPCGSGKKYKKCCY